MRNGEFFIKKMYEMRFLHSFLTIIRMLRAVFHKNFSNHHFSYNGRVLKYFFHQYNSTYANERKIEISIMRYLSQQYTEKEILEIGNVMSHYYDISHLVVDKYEKDFYKNLVNTDIVDFSSEIKYKCIYGVSTFEHIGFDEYPQNKPKILKAINHVFENLLQEEGILVITVPYGFNDYLDLLLESLDIGDISVFPNGIKKYEIEFFKRVSWKEWSQQKKLIDIKTSVYGSTYNCANAICILKFYK